MTSFFPASLVKLRRLLKIIQLDWEHDDSLLDDLKTYFSEKIVSCSEAAERAKDEYSALQRKAYDLEQRIKLQKQYADAKERKKTEKEFRTVRNELNELLSIHKRNTESVKRFQKMLVEVNKRSM